jgi:hypothetical protein
MPTKRTLRATLPDDANPAMMADLYEMLGLEIPPQGPGVTVTTAIIMHDVPPDGITDLKVRFEDLFPGTTYEVTEESQ